MTDVYVCSTCIWNQVQGDFTAPLGDDIDVGRMCLECVAYELEGLGVHPWMVERLVEILQERRLQCDNDDTPTKRQPDGSVLNLPTTASPTPSPSPTT